MHGSREELTVRYEQLTQVASAFWEWRNKLMRFVFTGAGGALVATAWTYDRELGRWIAVPLLFGAVLSYASAYLDRRSGWIAGECYRVGEVIEREWTRDAQVSLDASSDGLVDHEARGIFSVLNWSHRQRWSRRAMWRGEVRTFGALLPQLFRATSAALTAAAGFALWFPP